MTSDPDTTQRNMSPHNPPHPEHDRQGSLRGPMITLIIGALAVAFAPILPKMAMDASTVGPIATGFWRMFFAFPILLIVWLILLPRIKQATHEKKISPVWLILPGVIFGFDLLTWHLSFPLTTAANATLLANLEVVLVGFVGWLVLKERLGWQFAAGGVMALAGVAILMWSGPESTEGRSPLVGDLLALFTAFWYASYLLSIKKIRQSFGALTVMVCVTGVGAVFLLICTAISGETIIPDQADAWIYLILLAVIPHCLGQGLIVLSLAGLPASLAAVTLLLQPVGAACWGWLILGEALNAMQILAGMIVLVGIGLARIGSNN
ncbi:MAG: EamA family transporter [Phycisphaerae bacterium]|nr:EamA family transporter [Phycisphaerae bacterium]